MTILIQMKMQNRTIIIKMVINIPHSKVNSLNSKKVNNKMEIINMIELFIFKIVLFINIYINLNIIITIMK